MSYFSDLTTLDTAVNADVTTKATAASITPANVGGNIQALIALIQGAGIDAIVSLGNEVNDQPIIFNDGTGALGARIAANNAFVYSPDGLEAIGIHAADGVGNTYIEVKRNGQNLLIDGSLITANQLQKFINATGSIPVVIAKNDLVTQSGITSVASVPVAATSSFLISGYLNITTYATGTIYLNISFKDVHGTVVSGYHIGSASAAGYVAFSAVEIRALAGYNMVIIAVDASVGNTFDVGVTVTQIS